MIQLTVRSSPGDKSSCGKDPPRASTGDEAPSLKLNVFASKTGRKETRVWRSSSSCSSARHSGDSDRRESPRGTATSTEVEEGREFGLEFGREESSLPLRRSEDQEFMAWAHSVSSWSEGWWNATGVEVYRQCSFHGNWATKTTVTEDSTTTFLGSSTDQVKFLNQLLIMENQIKTPNRNESPQSMLHRDGLGTLVWNIIHVLSSFCHRNKQHLIA